MTRALVLVAALGLAACAREGDARSAPSANGVAAMDVATAQRAHERAMADPAQWATYGHDYTNQRWSTLSQVTTGNVRNLQLAWVHHSGIPHASETNPVVVDTVMYFSTSLNHVFAVDARNGKTIWEYAHDYHGHTVADCCSAVNKGVTVYGGRVYMGTVDAELVSLDARTGKLLWAVNVGDPNVGHHLTGAPTVVDGHVITGVSGGEQGCRCYVDSYDANTGERQWRFYTIPSPEQGGWWGKWRATDDWGMSFHRDLAKEHADSAKYADAWVHGGAPVWHHPAYDPALGLLFINTGNAAPDNDGSVRPGDNLYSSSIIALDVKTGKLRWYFQEVSHDVWDYDATTPPVLVDVPDSSGKMVHAVAEAGKDGYVYVLDRATGKPIRKSDPVAPQLNYMAPPDSNGVLTAPGTLGGTDWSPTAYSPETGYLYVDANYLPMMYWVNHEEWKPPAQYWGGTVAAGPKGNYGMVTAVDLRTGRIAWTHKLAAPIISGLMATKGGVVFTGTSDKHFIALDARTGQQLWSANTDAAVNAPPITYEIDGMQYIAVAATGLQTLNTPRGDEMLAFALPRAGTVVDSGSAPMAIATDSGRKPPVDSGVTAAPRPASTKPAPKATGKKP